MNWYILVIVSEDWFIFYHNTYLVRAESEADAERKVREYKDNKIYTSRYATTCITCGKRQPKADSGTTIIKK